MKTGKNLIWILMAAALLLGGCAGDSNPTAFARHDLDSREDDEWPSVTPDEVDGLPPCAGLDLAGEDYTIYVVDGSGGLMAVEIDGELVCVDDRDGLHDAGVTEPELPDPSQVDPPVNGATDPPADGTPIPADGTPIPAVADGTPIPANTH